MPLGHSRFEDLTSPLASALPPKCQKIRRKTCFYIGVSECTIETSNARPPFPLLAPSSQWDTWNINSERPQKHSCLRHGGGEVFSWHLFLCKERLSLLDPYSFFTATVIHALDRALRARECVIL